MPQPADVCDSCGNRMDILDRIKFVQTQTCRNCRPTVDLLMLDARTNATEHRHAMRLRTGTLEQKARLEACKGNEAAAVFAAMKDRTSVDFGSVLRGG